MGFRRRIILPGLFLGLLLSSLPAAGDEVRIIPMITVKEEYNDNIYFDKSSAISDFITTASPGLKLERNTERLQTNLTARIDERLYADQTSLNAMDQDYQANIGYALTPRLSFGAMAGYTQDSSPDRDIETTGLIMNALKRDRQKYGGSGRYAISEITLASLSAGYSKDHYEDNSENQSTPYFRDMETTNANLLVVHDLSAIFPATKGRASLGYANYQYVDSTIDNYTAMLGFSRAIHELWNVIIDAGVRYTPSQFDVSEYQFVPPFSFIPVTKTENTQGWGGVGNAVVSYHDDISTLDFTLNHDIMAASGRTGATERTSFSIRMNRRFAYEFTGLLSSGYFLNKSSAEQYSVESIDEQTFYITPGIRYNFTRDMAMDISYTYTRTTYEEGGDTDADRNLVMLRFSLQYPLFE
jgi:hypothetical protein